MLLARDEVCQDEDHLVALQQLRPAVSPTHMGEFSHFYLCKHVIYKTRNLFTGVRCSLLKWTTVNGSYMSAWVAQGTWEMCGATSVWKRLQQVCVCSCRFDAGVVVIAIVGHLSEQVLASIFIFLRPLRLLR